ncbi:MAG: Gfo/Idh/MocA family oxidoreductase [Eubacteriales bacterium]|nr:Gfo/Idh/MocA family oxidoreductase [Eubacteriales bacterium]
MSGKLKVGFVGCGAFVKNFIPLFKAHPYVESVAVTDLIKERRDEIAQKFEIKNVYDSFEDMLKGDVNTIAIFVQRQLHGPLAIAALEAGKHVYSAVPMASTPEDIAKIVELVAKTRLTYSMGETGYYRPCSVFCRTKVLSGEMGDFVYGEAQYNHDMRHFYKSYQRSGGEEWKMVAGIPPMLYPTHSTSMILSSACSYALKVAAFGYEDHHEDEIFGKGRNYWDNPHSNTSALLHLKNRGIARISENRRIGWYSPQSYVTCCCGTEGSYESSMAQHTYVRLKGMDAEPEDVSAILNTPAMEEHKNEPEFLKNLANGKWANTTAPIQNIARLPEEYKDQHDGHGGTHKFMVDDFCKAAYTGKLSPTNAWVAARFNMPGLYAHKSAIRDGECLDIPDLGDPPADWAMLDPDNDLAASGRKHVIG